MRNLSSIILILALLVPAIGNGQVQENRDFEKYFSRVPKRHAISFLQGYVAVPNSLENEIELESRVIFVGMIGFDYKYYLSPKFSTGLIYELELGQYFIEVEGSPVPRENVHVFTAFVGYELLPGLEVFAGPGYELEVHKNYFVFKVGVEFEGLIANNWYFAPELSYNYKEVYENVTLGIHFRKKFGKTLEE